MQYNITTWPYFFSPWDLLMGCGLLSSGRRNSVLCGVSSVAGIVSAYILPFLTMMNLAANIMTSFIFLYAHKSSTRQTVYLGFFAIVDLFYCFILAILYYIPSRGIPYASNARFYFFIDYQSAFSCIAFKYVFSFVCTFRSNMLVITMLDKYLSIQVPIKYGKLPTRYAWRFILITVLVTILMILPAYTQFNLVDFNGKYACWLKSLTLNWTIYYGLVSEFCPIQILINSILSVMLLIKVYLWLQRRRHMILEVTDENSKELSACILILFVASLNIVSSIPGVVAYFLSAFSVFAEDLVTILYNLFTALALRDIFWCLMPSQAVFNTIVYLCRLKYYRKLFISILKYRNIRTVASDISE
ncbi:unnamed protein product [Trichobilharzia szidati]|nr:unnamed protein product [Trichobilharzia szidati]CAH8850318.1 unnamed protein product [Trichobilharzia szidati]